MILLLNRNELLAEAVKVVADGDSVTVAKTMAYAAELATGGEYKVAIVEPLQYHEAVRLLSPLLPVVVLTESLDGRDARNAVRDGATAYLSTSCRVRDLREALDKARQGSPVMDARAAQQVIARLEKLQARSANVVAKARLSNRQVEVLRLLAAGRSNSGIAEVLELDLGYVETVVSDVYGKLGTGRDKGHSPRAWAAAWAWEQGLMGGEENEV
jgi:DNA-binding NarL/FixJ family response regulator